MNQWLKIYACFCLTLLGFTAPWADAKLSQSIDRSEISAGETFVLDIQLTEPADPDVSPDLSMIPSDFTIVSNSQYQNIQIFNGQRSMVKGWKLKLKTLQPGVITIPAIAVGKEFTQPIQITIKDASHQLDINGQQQAIFLTAEVDEPSPYVQQQVVLTLSLYRAIATHYENLSQPFADNAIIEKLGDDQVFDKTISGKNYSVYQRKYVVFPQKSGPLEISAVNFTADVAVPNQRNSFLSSTRPIAVATKPLSLQVKPQPAQSATPWLPALNVKLSEQWSEPGKQLTQGEPITWTLSLSVEGQSESQLPEITLPQIDGLQIYPDAPQKERHISTSGLIGQRVEKFAVIPSKSGQITLPPIELSWWDTASDQQKVVRLAGKTLQVNPSVAQTSTIAPPQLPALPQPQAALPDAAILADNQPDLLLWQSIATTALVLWLLTGFAYWRKNSKVGQPSTLPANAANLTQKQRKNQAMTKALNAINSANSLILEQSIIELANIELAKSKPDQPLLSLGALIARIDDQTLAAKLSQLQAQRYSQAECPLDHFISQQDLEKIDQILTSQPKHAALTRIPPLYHT